MQYQNGRMKRSSRLRQFIWLAILLSVVVVGVGSYVLVRAYYSQSKPAPVVAAKTKSIPHVDLQANYTAKVLFMGDTMLARTIGQGIVAGKNPYQYVQSTLDSYDYRVANVETTIADPSVAAQAQGKEFTFNAPLQSIKTLQQAHIDMAGLANNHTRDYGAAATADMIDRLQAANIKVVGAGKNTDQAFAPLVVDVPATSTGQKVPRQTIRMAIIAVNEIENQYTKVTDSAAGSAYFDKARIVASIQTAKQQDKADIVVVFPHWGVEYQTQQNADQVAWGHFFIDSGADIVIGGHPHVIEPTEVYNGKSIIYSMGNFIFDDMEGTAAKGNMVGLTLTENAKVTGNGDIEPGSRTITLASPSLIPTELDAQGYPHLQ